MKDELEQCKLLQNFIKIPVPQSVYKRRMKNLDEFLQKRNLKINEDNNVIFVKGIMLLKAAAVIGEEFTTSTLFKI